MYADTTDPDLVTRALDGDRAALGAIYDRYADRVHDLCRHMLGDPDDAADVCSQVFLVAFSRLGQLRDPDRLRAWLFAIARHEVYRRTRQRSRTQLVEGVDQMDRLMAARATATDGPDAAEVDPAAAAAVLRAAAAGLDERDRLVMELQLQGLDGDELAAALGTSVSTGYQQVHRMKERLSRSVGALLVARQGRSECGDLDRLLSGWDGTFTVLWRKRVARHVDRCEVCERRSKAVPATLLGGTAAALPMVPVSAVGAAPAAVRERVLSEAVVGSVEGGRGWRSDGFPAADHSRRSVAALVAAMVLVLLLVSAGLVALVRDDPDQLAAIDASGSTSSTVAATSSAPSTTSAPVPPGQLPAPTPPAPSTTTAAAPSVPPSMAVPSVPTTAPPAPAPPAPTVTTSVEPGPPVELSFVPRVLYHPTPATGSCGASVELVALAGDAAVQVQLWWRDAGGADGLVQLVRSGSQWRGVVEVPDTLAGPVTLLAVAVDAAGRTGVSATASVPVRACPTPG